MDDLDLIEKYFRKELNPDETARFNERLAADPAFKRKFDTESLVHKALQYSRERETIKSFSMRPVASASAIQWLDRKTPIMVGGMALAVWFLSTFSSGLTSFPPEYIKWVGLTVAVGGSILLLALTNKTMSLRLGMAGVFNGLLVFVTASGIDAINQGAEGFDSKDVTEANLVPFTGDKPWWPTQSLEDSLVVHSQQMQELRARINTLITSHMNTLPALTFGSAKYTTVVVPRSSTVSSGSTYQADIFLATSPLRQSIEMRVDGKPVPMEADPSGVQKGKVSFTATADKFDNTGSARKKFVAEIKVGDSTYTKIVEYEVRRK